MKLNFKKLTALFFAVLMLATIVAVPADAVWGKFTSIPSNFTLKVNNTKEKTFKFKGDGIDGLKVSTMGYDNNGNPAEVVRAYFVNDKMEWKEAGKTCKGVLKIEAVQKGTATVTLKMYNNNGQYLGDTAIRAFTVTVK